jgi:hypothetical protein
MADLHIVGPRQVMALIRNSNQQIADNARCIELLKGDFSAKSFAVQAQLNKHNLELYIGLKYYYRHAQYLCYKWQEDLAIEFM